MRRFLSLLLLLVVLAGLYYAFAMLVPYGGKGQRFVEVHAGDSSRAIASELAAGGAVRSGTAFLLYHYLFGKGTLKAGEYGFDHAETVAEVHRQLVRGEVYARTVVVPEGFNMFDIAQAVEEAGLGSRGEFLNEARSDTKLIADLSPDAKTLEGFLFPDTYRFSRNSSMRDIAAAMVKRFRQQSQAIGLAQRGPEQVPALVTMASIVEKETAVPSERPLVAGVFYNRLRGHIGLATDPSVIYASLLAGTWTGTIHQSELHSDSLYNTYVHAGLPPGPICNPGVSALQAAMDPTATDYLYFVADHQGHHRFARTLAEHDHNVSLYRHGK